ncbi:hypothetical protein [Halomicrobium sp. LC1Hm]|jgi:hypothetical protein|uniref:hypothetical protein n=1 Tax=Halomicrobium sp. LC1Hm TaxID=2610902 RepID=UPI0012983599|nr:hypothetical protein [Halomicrobium sp. LC1Hm]
MVDKYLEKGASALSATFAGTYGFDLVLPNTELIGSLGTAPSAILGVFLVLISASTIYKTIIQPVLN